ncbi:MAG: pyrroloquinoline quinone precursor peptide PqqA [Gammaproteobacteria bacterium]|nr:pyrroloquinoline quinone precursor peptide PqqA [Gammaproteobacteria bacterium]
MYLKEEYGMKTWNKPSFNVKRFGFEVTMYIYIR